MAMMGEVSDWGEREKKGLKYFLKFFLQNWRDVNQFMCQRGYFTLNFKNIFVLTIIFNTKHPKIETILKKKKKISLIKRSLERANILAKHSTLTE